MSRNRVREQDAYIKRLQKRIEKLEAQVEALSTPDIFWHVNGKCGGALADVMRGQPAFHIFEMDAAVTRGNYFAFRGLAGNCFAGPSREWIEQALTQEKNKSIQIGEL